MHNHLQLFVGLYPLTRAIITATRKITEENTYAIMEYPAKKTIRRSSFCRVKLCLTSANQYPLAEKISLVIHISGLQRMPQIKVFDTETAVKQLASFIADIGKKVTLVGFSLGAQLSVKLCAEYPQYFTSAIIVSPWLIKKEPMLSKVMAMNEKQFASFRTNDYAVSSDL